MNDDRLLDEQLDYYRARAGEYDEWWERRGRYDRGGALNARWHAEISDVRRVFDTLPLDGDVVELAPGTGYWTDLLVDRCATVTAIDGSAEMTAVNKARLGDRSAAVDSLQANLFSWVPEREWDLLVSCFWISHVPVARLADFLATCRRALRPGGTMFFLDGQKVHSSTAVDHTLPDARSEVMVRKLNDGRQFRIVKNFHEPDALIELADGAGLGLAVDRTDTFFQYGVGRRRP